MTGSNVRERPDGKIPGERVPFSTGNGDEETRADISKLIGSDGKFDKIG